MLIVDIEKAVTQVDDIFRENGLSGTEEAFQDASIRDTSSSGMYLEVIGCKIMPFEMHATGDAVWKHIAGLIESMPFRAYYERRPKVRTRMAVLLALISCVTPFLCML